MNEFSLSPEEHKQVLIQLYASKAGLRGKIDAKCIECIYEPLQFGTWRKQVEMCVCMACPLHKVRPKSESNDK